MTEHEHETTFYVDDRGNIAQFYQEIDGEPGDHIATLDREAGPKADEETWDGCEEVTAWAEKNGYPEIRKVKRV